MSASLAYILDDYQGRLGSLIGSTVTGAQGSVVQAVDLSSARPHLHKALHKSLHHLDTEVIEVKQRS